MSIIVSDPATIHTTVCGIYRWPNKFMQLKPGPYYSIIAGMDVLNLVRMDTESQFTHPVAVVDDFGNLVGVPA